MIRAKIFHIITMAAIVTTTAFMEGGSINIGSKNVTPQQKIDVRLETIKIMEERIAEEAEKIAEIKEQERIRLEEEERIRLEQEEAERVRLAEEQERLRLEQEEAERLRIQAEMSVIPNFNPYNLLEPSNLTRSKAYAMLEGSALQAAADAYVYAEEVYGVNAIFLMALTSLESGHGESALAMYNNNIGGVMGRNGDWAYFSDWGECIMYIADFLSNSYLTEDGIYFNGYSIWGVNVKYCQDDSDWSGMITSIAYTLMDNV